MPPFRHSRTVPPRSEANAAKLSAKQALGGIARYPLRTKDLDFLILAGCSCLLTFLYHPALDQIQGSAKTSQKPASSTTSSTPTPSSGMGVYSAVEPKRQNFRIEEEEA